MSIVGASKGHAEKSIVFNRIPSPPERFKFVLNTRVASCYRRGMDTIVHHRDQQIRSQLTILERNYGPNRHWYYLLRLLPKMLLACTLGFLGAAAVEWLF